MILLHEFDENLLIDYLYVRLIFPIKRVLDMKKKKKNIKKYCKKIYLE